MINKLKGKKRHRYRSLFFMGLRYRANSNIKKKYVNIIVPDILDLSVKTKRNSLIKVIELMHKAISRNDKYICFDFSKTKKIYSSAMLLLYAEMSNALNITERLHFSCIKPRNSKSSHVLDQIGIYRICREKFKKIKDYDDVIFWKHCSGKDVIGAAFDKVLDDDSRKKLEKGHPEVDLYGGCVEATKNAKRHAYIEARSMSAVAYEKTSWWMFSQVKDGILSVNVCDLGVGIPATLPFTRKNLFNILMETLGKDSNDAKLIEGAIHGNSSRSGESYRGNGLPKIARVAQETKRASLVVYSYKGEVTITKNNTQCVVYGKPVPGTIISWCLPIGEENAQNHIDCQ